MKTAFESLLLKVEEWQHARVVAKIKTRQAAKLHARKSSPWNVPVNSGYKWDEHNTDVSAS